MKGGFQRLSALLRKIFDLMQFIYDTVQELPGIKYIAGNRTRCCIQRILERFCAEITRRAEKGLKRKRF